MIKALNILSYLIVILDDTVGLFLMGRYLFYYSEDCSKISGELGTFSRKKWKNLTRK